MFKDEFRRDKWCFNHHYIEDFGLCCWQRDRNVKAAWLAWRILLFIFYLASTIYVVIMAAWVNKNEEHEVFIYLGLWSLVVNTLAAETAASTTVWLYLGQRGSNTGGLFSCLWRVLWIAYTISVVFTFLSCTLFWATIYDKNIYPMNGVTVLLYITGLVFYIDFALSAIPFRFLHFYIPLILFFIYVIVTLIYEKAGGEGMYGQRPIYRWLDWNERPGVTALCLFFVVLEIMLEQFVFFLLSYCKLCLRRNPSAEG